MTMCQARGEDSLLQLREHAQALAPRLGLAREPRLLESLIGSVFGTSDKARFSSQAGKAWAAGAPYDKGRLALFESLAAVLRSTPLNSCGPAMRTCCAQDRKSVPESSRIAKISPATRPSYCPNTFAHADRGFQAASERARGHGTCVVCHVPGIGSASVPRRQRTPGKTRHECRIVGRRGVPDHCSDAFS